VGRRASVSLHSFRFLCILFSHTVIYYDSMIDVTSSSSKELGLPAERKMLIARVSTKNTDSASGSARRSDHHHGGPEKCRVHRRENLAAAVAAFFRPRRFCCLPWKTRQEDEAKIEVLVLNSSSFILLESHDGAFSTSSSVTLPLPLTQTHARTDDE
jgi:hypothetical protein